MFDHVFDNYITILCMNVLCSCGQGASQKTDATVEAQPLWEYPCRALAQSQVVLSVDFDAFLKNKEEQTTFKFEV